MSNSSAALQKTVDRAGFIRWGAKSLKRMGIELIASTADQMKEKFVKPDWSIVTYEKAVGAKPRMYFVNGTPVFLTKSDEKQFVAMSATCPEEGGLLEWRERMGNFYCPFCQSEYDREGKNNATSRSALTKMEVHISDGQVLVNLADLS